MGNMSVANGSVSVHIFPASLKPSPECIFVSHVSNVSSGGYHCVRFPDCLAGCEAVRMHARYWTYMYSVLRHQNIRVAMLRIMVGESNIQA
jgi:competence transcription factor ComK